MNDADDPLRLVRPYALTGGRTRPTTAYPLEALVHTDRHQLDGYVRSPEERAIAELCRQSHSVAEVAALSHVPLGVARVLVADLVERGVVRVHTPGGDGTGSDRPDKALLHRVLSGLRKL